MNLQFISAAEIHHNINRPMTAISQQVRILKWYKGWTHEKEFIPCIVEVGHLDRNLISSSYHGHPRADSLAVVSSHEEIFLESRKYNITTVLTPNK